MYRTVPWSQKKYNEGWLDPTMRGYTDDKGLIPTLERAQEALNIYAEIQPAESLEIIYGRVCEDAEDVAQPEGVPRGARYLGIDVAAPWSAFWSIVGDFGPEPPVQSFLTKLNEHGLFSSKDEAQALLSVYRAEKLPDYESPLAIWKVWLVEFESCGSVRK
ncbi:MAG: hypothetical protein DMG26_17605 [Acidobacteria bacterium]|nr:MAG: hypothetical protein DMG26_17605 [Acidobacteriota bacterium]